MKGFIRFYLLVILIISHCVDSFAQDSLEFDGLVKIRTTQSQKNKLEFLKKCTLGFKGGITFAFPSNHVVSEAYIQSFYDKVNNLYFPNQHEMIKGAEFTNRKSFSGGIYLNYQINKNFSIQPELIFASLGYKMRSKINFTLYNSGSYEYNSYDEKETYCLNFIQLPVLLKAEFSIEKLHPFIYGGPVVSLSWNDYISRQVEYTFYNPDANNIYEEFTRSRIPLQGNDHEKNYGDILDIGIALGGGINYNINKRIIWNFDARYYRGFQTGYSTQSSKHLNLDVKQSGFFFLTGLGYKLRQ